MANNKLTSSRFNLAEFKRNIFRANPEAGTKLETLLDPVFWSHIAVNIKPYDTIEVIPEDGAYFVELIALGQNEKGLIVRALNIVALHANAPAVGSFFAPPETAGDVVMKDGDPVAPEGFSYKWMGPAGKYSVFRDADKAVVADKIPTKVALAEYFAGMTKKAA